MYWCVVNCSPAYRRALAYPALCRDAQHGQRQHVECQPNGNNKVALPASRVWYKHGNSSVVYYIAWRLSADSAQERWGRRVDAARPTQGSAAIGGKLSGPAKRSGARVLHISQHATEGPARMEARAGPSRPAAAPPRTPMTRLDAPQTQWLQSEASGGASLLGRVSAGRILAKC